MKILSGTVSRAHSNDAGIDVSSLEKVSILPNDSAIISTGIKIALDPNTFGLVKSRSGLSFRFNLEVGAGVIDEGYNGEIKVHLYNHGNEAYTVNAGDKVAQLIVLPVIYPVLESLSEDERGEKGFGSSGN